MLLPLDEYSQAKWTCGAWPAIGCARFRRRFFTIIDLRYTNMLQSFGLIRSNLLLQFIYKRPAYYAVQHMVGFFDDAVKPVGELEHQFDSSRAMTVPGSRRRAPASCLCGTKTRFPATS